jgi:dynein heavy chain
VYAREHGYELNTLTILTSVTKLMYYQGEALPPASPNMALVFGFQVEGCRWDAAAGQLDESRPKKPFSVMPVVICQAAREEEKPNKTDYLCPCYRTTARGATYVFTAQLKTKAPPQRWILAGVALILDVEGVSDGFAPGKEAALPA